MNCKLMPIYLIFGRESERVPQNRNCKCNWYLRTLTINYSEEVTSMIKN